MRFLGHLLRTLLVLHAWFLGPFVPPNRFRDYGSGKRIRWAIPAAGSEASRKWESFGATERGGIRRSARETRRKISEELRPSRATVEKQGSKHQGKGPTRRNLGLKFKVRCFPEHRRSEG